MSKLTFIDKKQTIIAPHEYIKNKRNPSDSEIIILKNNLNISEDANWKNVWVDNDFDPALITNSTFMGYVIFGKLRAAKLHFHDLELYTGVYNTKLRDCVIGDDNAIHNCVIENYHIGNRNILSNIQELLCTKHSKFGNGILMPGEDESTRIQIEVANENGRRAILPYENLYTSDAYLWSKFRDDDALMQKFREMTLSDYKAHYPNYSYNLNNDSIKDPADTKNYTNNVTSEQPCDNTKNSPNNYNTSEFTNIANTTLPATNLNEDYSTYGIVASDTVIKNTTLIKDAKIEDYCYIKGAFKIKNVTIKSSENEPTQIGEGVELVNGIVNSGCHIFYQAVAVRFLMMKNCQLKYGARLLNSVLGDNSTVSCCELLNNIIFPFHEQHHNSSFLIASTIMGQSNIAAGATIGSNHNSRGADGEIVAARGFWPGLCSSFKHNSVFSSFVLAEKGSYNRELNIMYPFSLISPSKMIDSPIHITPAWYFLYDMFAIIRNRYKFLARDKRVVKNQFIETDPIAPDSIGDIKIAMERIITLVSRDFESLDKKTFDTCKDDDALRAASIKFLENPDNKKFLLFDELAQKKYGAAIAKADKAFVMYKKIIKYFCVKVFIEYYKKYKDATDFIKNIFTDKTFNDDPDLYSYTILLQKWVNVGGQLIPQHRLDKLFNSIKNGSIYSWDGVHNFYKDCNLNYIDDKKQYAVALLKWLKSLGDTDAADPKNLGGVAIGTALEIYDMALVSHKKDFTDTYRLLPYRNYKEMEAVLGKADDCDFLRVLKKDTDDFCHDVNAIFMDIK